MNREIRLSPTMESAFIAANITFAALCIFGMIALGITLRGGMHIARAAARRVRAAEQIAAGFVRPAAQPDPLQEGGL
jgi:hypothetical protein